MDAAPHPYLAALLAVVLFSPVIIWNYENNWASFSFQSNRVLADTYEFSVHKLIAHIMILLTPVGFLAAALAFFPAKIPTDQQLKQRRHLFVQVFAGVPLFICFILSTFDSPRFHWTAPIWLAIFPTIAWMIGQTDHLSAMAKRIQAAWRLTIIACVLAYAFVLHYVVLGIPGIPYQLLTEHYFWREAAAEIKQIVQEVRSQTGEEPIVVGMSKWSVASALTFYTHNDAKLEVRSRNMFGESGAMYEFWFPSEPPTQRPIIQVGMKRRHLEQTPSGVDVKTMLDHPGNIEYRVIERYGTPVRRVYYRVSEGFKGVGAPGT